MELTNHSSIETNSAEPVNHNLSENSRQEDLPLALRKPSRTCVKPRPYAISSFLTFARASPVYKNFLITLNQISIQKKWMKLLKLYTGAMLSRRRCEPYLKITPGKKWRRSQA